MEWEPIETAPKDGRNILAIEGDLVRVVWWHPFGKCWNFGDSILDHPTHWMALPNPPNEIATQNHAAAQSVMGEEMGTRDRVTNE